MTLKRIACSGAGRQSIVIYFGSIISRVTGSEKAAEIE